MKWITSVQQICMFSPWSHFSTCINWYIHKLCTKIKVHQIYTLSQYKNITRSSEKCLVCSTWLSNSPYICLVPTNAANTCIYLSSKGLKYMWSVDKYKAVVRIVCLFLGFAMILFRRQRRKMNAVKHVGKELL